MSEGPSIRIQAEVTRQIRQHARSSMSTEVCGVLIGDGGEGDAVAIFAAIAGVNAAQAGTHVTFTQDAWEHIYKVKDAEYPEARIVGWYHSHPGFGVFLSEHDTFIQENFFSAVNQVAWVFDPHTDEEGCFGWVDGKIARLESITVVDSGTPENVSVSRELAVPGETVEQEEVAATRRMVRAPRRGLRWTASVLALVVAGLLGFTVSHMFFPSLYPLLVPVNPMNGQPLLHDPKTGAAVFVDPQRKGYVMTDRRTGKLVPVDPEALKEAQPSVEDAPVMQAPVPPASSNDVPKEKK